MPDSSGFDQVPNPPTDNEWPTDMPRPAIVGQRVGPYKLLQEIGEGGGGKVFLAEQDKPVTRRVALKIIKPGMDTEEIIARFEAERQALAMMDHPNIARVYDAGATEAGRPYFVMELVRGVPITQFCDENKLSIEQRLKLFILVCSAVQHAHQKGIIHRDIKPSNILVSMHDGQPTPKVIDFGIAKATGGRLTDKTYYTAVEQFVGTPAYMSPEQAALSNVDVDTRSDIYSLGVLLYELLTGRTPLDQKKLFESGVDEVRRAIREDEPPRPSTRLNTVGVDDLATTALRRHTEPAKLALSLRGDLDWIVMRCLEKDRERRYETASALAQDLQHYLNNEPVAARPPSPLYLLQKLARRHRVMFVAVAAVTAALVIGLGAAIWSAYRETVQREIANKETLIATHQKDDATKAEADTARALGRTDYLIALDLVRDDRLSEAVAHLVSALRASPDNQPAATLLCSILTMRNWLVPISTETTTPASSARGGPRGANGRNGPGLNFQGFAGRRGGPVSIPSPDGKQALQITNSLTGNSAQLVDLASNQAVFQPVENYVSGSFSPDGRRLVIGSSDHTFRIWDTAAGRPVTPSIPTQDDISSVAFSADGRLVVVISRDRTTVRLWDAAAGQSLSAPMFHEGNLLAGGASMEGQRVITRSSPGGQARNRQETTETWNYVPDAALLVSLRATGNITSVSESPDGKWLCTISSTDVQVWNAATGQPVGVPMKHDLAVRTVIFSPNGKRLATITTDNTLRVWDAATGQPVTDPIPDASRAPRGLGRGGAAAGAAVRLSFSPDGQKILFITNDSALRVLDAATGQSLLPALRPAAAVVFAVFSLDGTKILTVGNSAQVWDASTGAAISEFAKDAGPLDSAAFSPDGKTVLTTATSGEAQLWKLATGDAVGEAIRMDGPGLSAGFSADGSRILTFTRAAARVWDAATAQPVSELMQGAGTLTSAAFSADGRWVITSGAGTATSPGTACVWDANTGLAVSVPIASREARLSPDGHRLLTLGADGVVRIWPLSDNVEPPWLLDLAEKLAQCRLDSTGSLVFDAGKPIDDLSHLATQEKDAGQPMVQWARRLLGVGTAGN
jgi:serine/threonine protein kinase/WD40 repeat protein